MAVPTPRFQLWFWGKKKEKAAVSDDNSSSDWSLGLREPETTKMAGGSSSRRMRRKWQSRDKREIDREHDIVLVPSDGGCLSGSESDDSDWSIGWLEPLGSEFFKEDEVDDSFAVLVPCYKNLVPNYRNHSKGLIVEPPKKLFTNHHFSDGKQFVDEWLNSLHNF